MIEKYLFVFIIVGIKAITNPPIISLPNGKISGHVLKSGRNSSYYAYQEIPYASPPVGKLRFKEPTPPQDWDGILDATRNTKICYQLNSSLNISTPDVNQTEDCLYLNVYTPKKPEDNSSDLLPVLFWIHGGAFRSGDGTYQLYGPRHFIDYNIVIVTINYRLGPLGFLTTNDRVIPANLGLKDQNFALNWTNQNIELFGGDPTKITIVGQSAGAASVGHLLLSKKSSGLFRGAIMGSGTSICYWAHQPFYTYYAYQMGTILSENALNNTSEELLEILQNSSVYDIMNANMPNYLNNEVGEKNLIWLPVIEDERLENALVTGHMEDDLENGNINKVPILLGFNSEEELLFLQGYSDVTGYVKSLGKYYDDGLWRLINNKHYDITPEDKDKAGDQLRKIYTNGLLQDDVTGVVKFLSDEKFTTPIIRHAVLQSNYTDVYLYQYSYKGLVSLVDIEIEGADNVGHGEDLIYLWDFNIIDWNKMPTEDDLTHRRLIQLWTNFIKYLNPTPVEDDLLANILWPKVSPNNITYLNINATLEVQTDPKKYKEWKSVIDTYAVPPLDVY